jgi:hypothetical protein
MSVISREIGCDRPRCPHYIVISAEQAPTLRKARAWYRQAGWRYVPGHPASGPAQDLCPTHANEQTEPDPPLFDVVE